MSEASKHSEDICAPGEEGPVTVSIARNVKPGRETEYEQWAHGILEVQSQFPGSQGANVLRPSPDTGNEYVVIYRFDTYANTRHWEQSDIRREWVDKLDEIVEGEPRMKRVTGLEVWFDLPEITSQQSAPRYKMAIVLTVLVYAMLMTLGPLLRPILDPLMPHALTTFIIVALQVFLLTYVIMPPVTRLLKGWLYR